VILENRQAGAEVAVAVEAMARVLRAVGLKKGVDAKQAAHTILRALLAAGPYTLVAADDRRPIRLTPAMIDVAIELMAAWDDPDTQHPEWGGSYPRFLEQLFRRMLAGHDPPVAVAMQASG